MNRYVKAITALLGGLGAWGITAGADEVYSDVELWGLCAVLATAVGVYAFPNRPPVGEPRDPNVSETAA